MDNQIALVDMKKRAIRTIPYELVITHGRLAGGLIRSRRILAGYKSQRSFAAACGWCQTAQYKYEMAGVNLIGIDKVLRMQEVLPEKTLPFLSVATEVKVCGGTIRKMRIRARFSTQESFALACCSEEISWSSGSQSNCEAPHAVQIKIEVVQRMIVVINGGT